MQYIEITAAVSSQRRIQLKSPKATTADGENDG